MNIEEIREAKKAWDTMQENAEQQIEKSRKEIFTKHGLKIHVLRQIHLKRFRI